MDMNMNPEEGPETQILTRLTATRPYVARPRDPRCLYWAKVATADQVLSADLAKIDGMHTLPGDLVRKDSDHELRAWTVIFEGEANHPKKQRGWTFDVSIITPMADEDGDPSLVCLGLPDASIKAWIKAHGGQALMSGSGPHAAMLRAAQWVLQGAGEADRLARLHALVALT